MTDEMKPCPEITEEILLAAMDAAAPTWREWPDYIQQSYRGQHTRALRAALTAWNNRPARKEGEDSNLLSCAKRLIAASDAYDETIDRETDCRLTLEDLRDAVAKAEAARAILSSDSGENADYARGWKDGLDACVNIVTEYADHDVAMTIYHAIRALPDPISPTNGKEGK